MLIHSWLSIYRSTRMRDTSSTVMGRSSTWASPWSTSSRSVSGCRRYWRTTSRKRTRTTVKPAPLSSPGQLLQHNMQQIFLTRLTHRHHLLTNLILAPLLKCSTRMCKGASACIPHPPTPHLVLAAGQKDKINLRCEQSYLSLSLLLEHTD